MLNSPTFPDEWYRSPGREGRRHGENPPGRDRSAWRARKAAFGLSSPLAVSSVDLSRAPTHQHSSIASLSILCRQRLSSPPAAARRSRLCLCSHIWDTWAGCRACPRGSSVPWPIRASACPRPLDDRTAGPEPGFLCSPGHSALV